MPRFSFNFRRFLLCGQTPQDWRNPDNRRHAYLYLSISSPFHSVRPGLECGVEDKEGSCCYQDRRHDRYGMDQPTICRPAKPADHACRRMVLLPQCDQATSIPTGFNTSPVASSYISEQTSGVSSKAAKRGQFKTGQRKWPGTVRCCTRS